MATLIIPIENLPYRQIMPAPPSENADFAPIYVPVNPVKLLETAIKKHNSGCEIVYPEQIDDGRRYATRNRKMQRAFATGGPPPSFGAFDVPHSQKVMVVTRAGNLTIDRALLADCPGLTLTPIVFARWRRVCYLTENTSDRVVISDEPTTPDREHYEFWAHGHDLGMAAVVARKAARAV